MSKAINNENKPLKAIDFFCGAGGMTSGFIKAGVDVIAGIDFDKACEETYESNNTGSKFILADIKKLSFDDLSLKVGVTVNDDNLIFIGCSPCQYWSIIKTDKKKSEESKNLIQDFQRFVDYYNPGFVVIENVPGIVNKAESPLADFLKFLDNKGYEYDKAVINTSHFGVPQTRKRFLLIASRVKKVNLPSPNKEDVPTVRKFISPDKGFPIIKAGHKDKTSFMHTVAGLEEINILRLRETEHNGGTRLSYVNNKELSPKCHNGMIDSFRDTYGRMYWDKPGPTITTKFFSISNGRFAHPEQDRGISLREGATLQTFDKTYKFSGTSVASIAKQIGNAVPPALSRKIAEAIIQSQ